jgi:hypothetical protein
MIANRVPISRVGRSKSSQFLNSGFRKYKIIATADQITELASIVELQSTTHLRPERPLPSPFGDVS